MERKLTLDRRGNLLELPTPAPVELVHLERFRSHAETLARYYGQAGAELHSGRLQGAAEACRELEEFARAAIVELAASAVRETPPIGGTREGSCS